MQINQNPSSEDEFQNIVCSNKHISSYKISWSAFSKVISTSKHAQVFDNLPSLLISSQNLSNNEEEKSQEIEEWESDKIFQKIISEIKLSYDAIKTIFKSSGQLNQYQDEAVTEEILTPNKIFEPEDLDTEISSKLVKDNAKVLTKHDKVKRSMDNNIEEMLHWANQGARINRQIEPKIKSKSEIDIKDWSRQRKMYRNNLPKSTSFIDDLYEQIVMKDGARTCQPIDH